MCSCNGIAMAPLYLITATVKAKYLGNPVKIFVLIEINSNCGWLKEGQE